ncbi:MAG TPA: hydrogenase iron-sulfur subunit [bacterium (Candidatus Stahlbacteria)]|nr:hydrogenase iron-sulfur subunit [Candidatus Stahlbacteria bacterium]
MKSSNFEPKIIAFICKWCTSQAADLAGTSRLHYPPNVIPIRYFCSSRVDPQHVLLAYKKGADGVLIGGCHFGDCHYQNGNYRTYRRYLILRSVIEAMGVDPKRFRLEWISAAEGKKFVQVVTEMVDDLKRLGPIETSSSRDR